MENSKIEWTDHTFNPWRGCTKVSPGCDHCYAEAMARRNPASLGTWGPSDTRVVASESYWSQPLHWNKEAEQAGERRRVFCASMADVFEGPETMANGVFGITHSARERLWDVIEQTSWLDWLLLTKRPENMRRYTPLHWWSKWPPNVWAGATAENQEQADKRIPHLIGVPVRVRFLSCEPLLGPISLSARLLDNSAYERISWVICGGESGPNARPTHPDCVRALRDQCASAGIPFFFKGWGAWFPFRQEYCGRYIGADGRRLYIDTLLKHEHHIVENLGYVRCGKCAGRQLDGREWSESPINSIGGKLWPRI